MERPRKLAFLFSAVVGCLGIAACNGGESSAGAKLQIAFITNCVDPFWFPGRVGAQAAGRDLGVEVDVQMPANATPVEQKQILEDMLARGVAGIAISPIDPTNQTTLLDRVAAEVPLITHDSDAPLSKRRCFIGVDNYDAGLLCGELVKEALPDGGKIMLFIGNLAQDNAKKRRQGVIDAVLGNPPDPNRYTEPGKALRDESGKYVILGTLLDGTQRPRAKANAEDALNQYPDLACMVGLFNSNAPMCLEALRGADKLGQIKIVGFDEDERTLQGIKDGHIVGTVVQDPYRYGYESVKMLVELARNENAALPANRFLHIKARRIDKSNVAEFWADLKSKLAQGEKR